MLGPLLSDAALLSAEPGAYALLIALDRALEIQLPHRPSVHLPQGRYIYCGSAYGPGGIRARVGRHVRVDKAVRWHIDRLTAVGTVVGFWAFPGGNECRLVAGLSRLPAPIPGFGSSDCRTCVSHLLALPSCDES